MSCQRGCCATQREHWLSVSLSAAATPTRRRQAAEAVRRDAALDRDLEAYKRMRDQGMTPTSTVHAAAVESMAECSEQVETGLLNVKPESFRHFSEAFGHSVTEPGT